MDKLLLTASEAGEVLGIGRTTREIYTHVSERMLDEATQAITDAVSDVVDSSTQVERVPKWVPTPIGESARATRSWP